MKILLYAIILLSASNPLFPQVNSPLYQASYKNVRVCLDYFYNNEYKNGKRYHYIWEDKENSGFSSLGEIFKQNGADIDSLTVAPSSKNLNKFNIYIIVDPDTPDETAKPNYIELEAIKNITDWVKNGGVLVLMANDSTNCEFTHLNMLAGEFGIHFNEDCQNKVLGKNYEMGKFDSLPDNDLFRGVKKIFIKEMSSLTLSKNAVPVLTRNNMVFMASAEYGKGFIFAVGDPWVYNEYIDNRKLLEDFHNFIAAKNLAGWLLSKTNSNN